MRDYVESEYIWEDGNLKMAKMVVDAHPEVQKAQRAKLDGMQKIQNTFKDLVDKTQDDIEEKEL